MSGISITVIYGVVVLIIGLSLQYYFRHKKNDEASAQMVNAILVGILIGYLAGYLISIIETHGS